MALTKLEKTPYQDLNSMSAKDLTKILENALMSAYRKLDKLEEAGYEDSNFNKTFRSMMGETIQDAMAGIKGESLNELRRDAAYVKRHLANDESSVAGKAKQEMRALQQLDKVAKSVEPGFVESEWKAPYIKRRKGGYEMHGKYYTKEDIKKFWEIYHKATENYEGRTLRQGTNEALALVTNLIFVKGITDPVKISEMLKEEYERQQDEEEEKRQENERRLSSTNKSERSPKFKNG